MSAKKILAILARACTRNLQDSDDVGIAGVYTCVVTPELSVAEQASAVLDRFHKEVPVATLDDFEFVVFDPETGLVIEPADRESYTMTKHAWELQEEHETTPPGVFRVVVTDDTGQDVGDVEIVALSRLEAKPLALAHFKAPDGQTYDAFVVESSMDAPDAFVVFSESEFNATGKGFRTQDGWDVEEKAQRLPHLRAQLPEGQIGLRVIEGDIEHRSFGFDVQLNAFFTMRGYTKETVFARLLKLMDSASCLVLDEDNPSRIAATFEASTAQDPVLAEINGEEI